MIGRMPDPNRKHRAVCKALLAAILLVSGLLVWLAIRTMGDGPTSLRNPAGSTIVATPHPDPGSLPSNATPR